jgi:hypothetical protein
LLGALFVRTDEVIVVGSDHLRIVLTTSDVDEINRVRREIVTTATLFPNSRQLIDEYGSRIISIPADDLNRKPELDDELRQRVHTYEQLLASHPEDSDTTPFGGVDEFDNFDSS